MDLIPLQRSAEYDEIEAEFKALFISLYKKRIDAQVMEANTLGMPHLGPDSFISRGLNNDGLALLNETATDKTRMLFMGWRYLNPQRGTNFLRFYLRALFGDVFTIDQLWCRKDGIYPVDVMSETEIQVAGLELADFFLTSRLRVDIETEIVPERILKAARSAIAARFVLELRAARRPESTYAVMFTGNSVLVCRTTGTANYLQPPILSPASVGPAAIAGGSNFIYSFAGGKDTQSHLN